MKKILLPIIAILLFSPLDYGQTYTSEHKVTVPRYVHWGNVEITENLTVDSALHLTPIEDVTYHEGVIYYDSDDGTMVIVNEESEIGMNVGQELWIKVRNNSGADITDGTPVYFTGALGQLPTIAPASASTFETADFKGLATHTIEDNTNGYITTDGVVRGINTSGTPYEETWEDGDEVWVGVDAGSLTNVEPINGYYTHHVGVIAYAHNTQGQILILPHPDFHSILRVTILIADSVFNFADMPSDSTGLNTGDLYRIVNQVYWKY